MKNVHFQASKSGQNLENGHLQTQRTRELATWYLSNLGDTNSRIIKNSCNHTSGWGFHSLVVHKKLFEPILYLKKITEIRAMEYMGKTVMYAVASRPPLQKQMCISRKHFVLYVNFESKIDSISFKKSFTMHINSPEYRIILHMFSNFLTMFFYLLLVSNFAIEKKIYIFSILSVYFYCIYILHLISVSWPDFKNVRFSVTKYLNLYISKGLNRRFKTCLMYSSEREGHVY